MSLQAQLQQGLNPNDIGQHHPDWYKTLGPARTPPFDASKEGVGHFLKVATDAQLVELFKSIPEELKRRFNEARDRANATQVAYEQVLYGDGGKP